MFCISYLLHDYVVFSYLNLERIRGRKVEPVMLHKFDLSLLNEGDIFYIHETS